ncbi:MAG: hypothetical protein FWE04_00860 [Oscillospiraceae bacterium]|nr:hypothetical protein [Oscillospiraceae bacterium]
MTRELKYKYVKNGKNEKVEFVCNGCVVSITSTPQGKGDPLGAVKEILLSSHRTNIKKS